MANVNIKFNGKEFLLSCDDGQEEHLEELSNVLNNKFNELKTNLGNIGENKLLLITSIKVIDEYFETKKIIDSKKKELEILKSKFLDLKNLIYEYKDNKEKEIIDLKEDQVKVKNEIDSQKITYENLVDKATSEIESFIKKHAIDSKVQ